MAKVTLEMIQKLVDNGKARAYFPKLYCLRLQKVEKAESYENEFGEGSYDLEPGDPKLEGTCGEHWSPSWEKITKKYFFMNNEPVTKDICPSGRWIRIQTNPDESERRKSITWAMDPRLLSEEPFEIDGLHIDPRVDMMCFGGTAETPTLDWGVWPVKDQIFWTTYEEL